MIINATPNSSQPETQAGIATRRTSTIAPTMTSDAVCPTPHNAPTSVARQSLRCSLTMVVTATT